MAIGSAAAMAAAVSLVAAAPASAQPFPWWHHHYYHGYYGPGPGPAIGAGLLGFAAGAALAGAAQNGYYADQDGGHVAACESQYRSYDIRTDSYLGYDGFRHTCEL